MERILQFDHLTPMVDNDNKNSWEYPVGHIYQPAMVEFFSFMHGHVEEYMPDTVLTTSE
jgi:hypothetical protein